MDARPAPPAAKSSPGVPARPAPRRRCWIGTSIVNDLMGVVAPIAAGDIAGLTNLCIGAFLVAVSFR